MAERGGEGIEVSARLAENAGLGLARVAGFCQNSATAMTTHPLTRRRFLKATAATGLLLPVLNVSAQPTAGEAVAGLPKGSAPPALDFSHFPDRLHAFVWRNWSLIPLERMAKVVGGTRDDLLQIGLGMGLAAPGEISVDFQSRSYITVIRRNWHLLPYGQLLELLGWTPEKMKFILREDDFLYVKLGNLKPASAPIRFAPPGPEARARASEIKEIVERRFGGPPGRMKEPLFSFVQELSKPAPVRKENRNSAGKPLRFCYSYFALYGDPLLEESADPFPLGYLEKLANLGVNGVWLQGVLAKLAPFPWDTRPDNTYLARLENLRRLIKRAGEVGIGIHLYLNEPRSLPLAFFEKHPELKGAPEGEHAALCTSHPEVQKYLAEAVASICRAAPDLAGFFTISASENLSNCWSHNGGGACPRCSKRRPAEVIAEVNGLFQKGIDLAGSKAKLIAWDWGWADGWAEEIIQRLPASVAHMSVSEWSIPIQRGGVNNVVGEYSISTVGPGPRAKRHWEMASRRGLRTIAKIQAGNTWELSAVPYIPALAKVAQHAVNLRRAGIQGLMLGWTLGGYPSPNLEVVSEVFDSPETPEPEAAMLRVAERRFGKAAGAGVARVWSLFSEAFGEFPYDGGVVYNAPMQYGPSNLLWAEPTGYHATMVGFPYDDLDGWRGPYPAPVFAGQFEKISDGFSQGIDLLKGLRRDATTGLSPEQSELLAKEISVAEAAQVHFESVAAQTRFVELRRALAAKPAREKALALLAQIEAVLKTELGLARRLHDIQAADARIGFEATNQYYYVPLDLAEKVLNCERLLGTWVPKRRAEIG